MVVSNDYKGVANEGLQTGNPSLKTYHVLTDFLNYFILNTKMSNLEYLLTKTYAKNSKYYISCLSMVTLFKEEIGIFVQEGSRGLLIFTFMFLHSVFSIFCSIFFFASTSMGQPTHYAMHRGRADYFIEQTHHLVDRINAGAKD